ncbi:anthranilate synthase component I [Thermoplasma volcanium GSS1]|uniref:anthranilate synthase n=1 Tax=Thermoplasma volcanium (strain ATCC 51530 / DSM 4299 / JCM 9571 / NBRC 15438 / GSS1) TaxID=273116 RepID=Q979V7_THEVO|nr:anthranilate synthase component I [Thermoplasma volcanium]BAB60195.1 anthranilate synthase component I [Thermoplasma volcanium GSS1]
MLADQIDEFRTYSNFAYFASFPDRVNGYEYVFASDTFQNDPSKIFDGALRPILVTYDYVNEIFDTKVKSSGWPYFLSMDAETIEKRPIMRTSAFKKKNSGSLKDEALEGKIRKIVNLIRNGEVLQVVISREFEANVNVNEKIHEFLTKDRSRYVFYYRFGKYEVVGSSPENIFTVIGNRIYVDPIAGTISHSFSSDTLYRSEKDRCEHRMLLDLARNDVSKFADIGSLEVPKVMEIEEFSSVKHLVSQVKATFSNKNYVDILRAMFPAGTVTGSPKERAIEIIDKFEETPRGPYGGAVGIVGSGIFDMGLAIRMAYSSGNGFRVRAGAGIVKDSDPSSEVNEIYNKARSVL